MRQMPDFFGYVVRHREAIQWYVLRVLARPRRLDGCIDRDIGDVDSIWAVAPRESFRKNSLRRLCRGNHCQGQHVAHGLFSL